MYLKLNVDSQFGFEHTVEAIVQMTLVHGGSTLLQFGLTVSIFV